MIARYTREQLGGLWTDEARMEYWRQVEVAACRELPWLLQSADAEQGSTGPSAQDLEQIEQARFSVDDVRERERATGHDVAAFVDVLGQAAGAAGRWIHYGLTSSDVLDTALALQLRDCGEQIVPAAWHYFETLRSRAREHVETLCVGRTHGVHAEPTTFGIKLAGFAFEAHRNAQRLQSAFSQTLYGAISGPVGTYSATAPEFEQRILERLGLRSEPVSTQVVPRDRHAELLSAIALSGAGLERLGTEIRHLQRTEVQEVQEQFGSQQKGSSAMPHKRNPIASEQICGLARVLRANAQAGLENVALWHERDISHSSVERVVLPDSTILIDYLLHRATALVEGLQVDVQRMRQNIDRTHGALFSAPLLLALVRGGMARDDAYRIVQEAASRAWHQGEDLRAQLADQPAVAGIDLDAVFDPAHYTRYARQIVARLDALPAGEGHFDGMQR